MGGWLAIPRAWLASSDEIARFAGRIVGQVYGLRVFRFFGESMRQAGILIVSSTLVIWGLVFIIGLQSGIEGAYFNRSIGNPAYADEIDALEVIGINSVTFLCATRLLASWIVLPFVYIVAIGAGFLASYIAVVQQIGEVSRGGYLDIFWMFQNPQDLLYSMSKGMVMATAIVLVGCYYGYHARGGPLGVGTATAKSMVLNIVLVHLIGMLGTQLFWGANPRAPIGG
jgi:phospholipid/cholesterol/gamma-HCH transport system permease protein